jgi:V-type H+-transporting ATPase subunit a
MFKENEFFWVFQEIVNTYGIPSYKEVNPAVFCIISFPFFFGVMFGDIMHGSLLFLFATYLCWSSKKEGTIAAAFGPIRYIFLLMGLFSTFCGLVYNDFSSLGTNIMGDSCYTAKPENSTATVMYAKKLDKECMYPIGIDPVWYRSTQEIMYMNSLKMKMSVIFGVAQMTLGTLIKGLNALYFKRYIEFIFDVISQVVLLWALFGFMDILIILKWTTDWETL